MTDSCRGSGACRCYAARWLLLLPHGRLCQRGIRVLLEAHDLSIAQSPDVRERRREAPAGGFVAPAVLPERDDRVPLGDERVWHGAEAVPLRSELGEDIRQDGFRPHIRPAVGESLSLRPPYVPVERAQYARHVTVGKGCV